MADISENAKNIFHRASRDSWHDLKAPPRTPVERAILGIWTSILNCSQIGIDDDFFNLGGNSILADEVTGEIREVFLVNASSSRMFEFPTIAQQAGYIEGLCKEKKRTTLSIPRISRSERMDLSYSQLRLWFFEQLQPNSALYNSTLAMEMSGPLDIHALLRSLNEIVHRHEALRTTFESVAGLPFQIIAPELSLALPIIDLSESDFIEQQADIARLSYEEARQPFNLVTGPLIRTSVLRKDSENHILLLSIHHIVSDGWSFGVLMKELEVLYRTFHSRQPSPLLELPIQYVDCYDWKRQRLQGEFLDSLLGYWRKKLIDLPPTINLPIDHPRPSGFSFEGAGYNFVLPMALVRALKMICQQEGVTLYMLLLAGFNLLMYGYSRQDDFGIGTPIANRNRAEMESLIGIFINMLVIRADLSGNPTFRELLNRVKITTIEAYAHQDIPFEILVEKLRPPRGANCTPFFQVMFILENISMPTPQLPGLDIHLSEIESGTAKFDLSLYIFEQAAGTLVCKFEYATSLFAADTIKIMGNTYLRILERVVIEPDIRVLEITKDHFSANMYHTESETLFNSSTKRTSAEEREDLEL